MRAVFINEFERKIDPKKSLGVGQTKIRDDFGQHLKDVKTHEEGLSDEDKKIKNMQKFYAFIFKPKFIEVEIDGETYHKKTYEIENLYQVDTLDKSDLTAVSMMKLRARVQADGSKLAFVWIPTFMHDAKTTYDDEISPKLMKYIMKNKTL